MRKLFFVLLGIFLVGVLTWFIFSVKFLSGDFRNNLWAPAYLFLHGGPTYRLDPALADIRSVWFPQILGIFFPLGWLSLYQATNIWLILNIGLLVFLTWLVVRQTTPDKPGLILPGILILSVLFFPPTIRMLSLGQVDIILVVALIGGTYAVTRNNLILGGFLFALALVKPQLCLLVLFSVIWTIGSVKKQWKNALKLVLITGVFAIVLTIPLWFGNKNWVGDFISNLRENPLWSQPSIFSQLAIKHGSLGIIIWLAFFIFIFYLNLRTWAAFEPRQAILWSLALTTIASPYIWSWDFVLLLPLFIQTAVKSSNRLARSILFFFYIASSILAFITLRYISTSDAVLWWFPYLTFIGILISLWINKKLTKVVPTSQK
jgi:hypothetical protein